MDKRSLLLVSLLALSFFVVNFFFGSKRAQEPQQPQAVVEQVEQIAPTAPEAVERPNSDEKFYVLETPFQQIVFSSLGGSVAEINLPFQTDRHSLNVVKEIGFDRDLQKQVPESDHFPNFNYFTAGENAAGPFVEHADSPIGGYYPLIRRSLIEENGKKILRAAPENYALNIVSRYPELAELPYRVTHFDSKSIVFQAETRHRLIRKTYTLPDDASKAPYVFNLKIEIEGDREATQGLWLTTGVPEVELMSGKPMPLLQYRVVRNSKGDTEKIRLPKEGAPIQAGAMHPEWVVNSNGFFALLVDPLDEVGAGYKAEYVPGTSFPSRLTLVDQQHDLYPAGTLPGYRVSLPLRGGNAEMNLRVFAGPLAGPVLRTLDATYTNPETGQNPGYRSAQSFRGYFAWIAAPFSKFLLLIMRFFHYLTGSWGLSIILLTVVLRILLYPLSSWSMKSMRRMQLLAPEVAAIQARNKKDPRKGQMEVMALYRSKKVNPFSGCLPLLIQMPFLIAMFDLLKSTFELRGDTFIPGWIDNLTAPDVLFSWNTPIFFIGTEFHLLPFILGGVMWLQQRLSSTLPKDKSLWTDTQKQQRLMGNIMVIVFTVMFYRFASGLNIYFISSMALGILQQWLTNRQLDRKKSGAEPKKNGRRAQA